MNGKGLTFLGKKILFIHYRVGRTDGVSLEMINWKAAMERLGAEVKLCAGVENTGADFVIEGLEHEFDTESEWLDKEAFGNKLTPTEIYEVMRRFELHKQKIESGFDQAMLSFEPDLVIVSNIFSVGENLPATVALTNCLDKYQIPTIAIHHDFYWENSRYEVPSCEFIGKVLEDYLPIQRPWMRHACINSLGQEALLLRKDINATILSDNIDFEQPAWIKKEAVQKLLSERGITENEIVLLQATRVVKRKNIEVALELAAKLQQETTMKGKVVFLLAGYAEKRDEGYLQELIGLAKELQVRLVQVADLVGKEFSLEEVYPFSDIVTYPSEYEGFGNQFLEAVFAKKPIVLFEYPVYIKDIKPKGFEVISLGSAVSTDEKTGLKKVPESVIDRAVKEVVEVFTNKNRREEMERTNFIIARKYFSTAAAIATLEEIMATFSKKEADFMPAVV